MNGGIFFFYLFIFLFYLDLNGGSLLGLLAKIKCSISCYQSVLISSVVSICSYQFNCCLLLPSWMNGGIFFIFIFLFFYFLLLL